MHDVEAGLAGSEAAEDGIQVGAIHVGNRARLVDRGQHVADLVLEHAQRARVGEHQRGGVRAERGPQGVEVDPAVRVRPHGPRCEADHGRGGGVRTVGAVGDDHDVPLFALSARMVVGACHEHAGQLPVGTGSGLEADRGEAADLAQELRQQPLELEAALAHRHRVERVGTGQARQAGGPLVQLGVVLHGARAEGIEADVDGVVQPAQPVEVADQVELADLRQPRRLHAASILGNRWLAGGRRLGGFRRCGKRTARRPGVDRSNRVGSTTVSRSPPAGDWNADPRPEVSVAGRDSTALTRRLPGLRPDGRCRHRW